MPSWRDNILQHFTPQVARLTLVADPDGLLLEEGILEGIHARGFDLIPFDDPIAFRYAYESKYRARWDRGEATDLVVVLHAHAGDLAALPYDLLQAGRRLTFSLGAIFPHLSYPVVTALDRGDLDALYVAQARHAPGVLGVNATKEFVLRHVFEIAPELIKQPADLLRVLLRRHYREQRIPDLLEARLLELLRQRDTFAGWPLERLLPDRAAFFAFLQERWPHFLNRLVEHGDTHIQEELSAYGLALPGPRDLPFEHHDIRVYMDSLFLDGILLPVPHAQADALVGTWVGLGVETHSAAARAKRLDKALAAVQASVPAADARHGEWFQFARRWAELLVLFHAQGEAHAAADDARWLALQIQVDARFNAWLGKRYAGLVNLPPAPPVMLHHLARFLARQVEGDARSRIALVVVDGLALDQWLVMREALARRQPRLQFREQTLCAWIPSLTAVSRQAIFAGKPPVFFPNSLHTTERESALWTQFWADQGLAPAQIVYTKGLGDGSLGDLGETLAHPKVRVAGLVVDTVDKIMHGMQLGTAGMHNQVRQWSQQPYLGELLALLLARGFRVFLTSDHGNIEAEGCGRPAEGAVADLRGERVRVYPDVTLRDLVQARFPTASAWNAVGLPDGYLPLLAPPRQAFVQAQQRTVAHGGASLEELLVPLIQIEMRA